MIFRLTTILILVFSLNCYAQSKWVPSALRVGVDLYDIAVTSLKSNRTIYEFNADIDFHKYFLAFDYGTYKASESNILYDYEVKGYFWRLGPDINLIPYEKNRSVFFFGFRYAEAAFNDNVQFTDSTYFYGNGSIFRENKDMYAKWVELVMGLKVPLWKWVQLGLTGRMKFGKSMGRSNSLESLLIPGYGNGISRTEFALNYHLLFRIPFRDKPIPPKPERKKVVTEQEGNTTNRNGRNN